MKKLIIFFVFLFSTNRFWPTMGRPKLFVRDPHSHAAMRGHQAAAVLLIFLNEWPNKKYKNGIIDVFHCSTAQCRMRHFSVVDCDMQFLFRTKIMKNRNHETSKYPKKMNEKYFFCGLQLTNGVEPIKMQLSLEWQ